MKQVKKIQQVKNKSNKLVWDSIKKPNRTSIIIITIFVLILATSIFVDFDFNKTNIVLTQDQIVSLKNTVALFLTIHGDTIENYKVNVVRESKHMNTINASIQVAHVSIYNNLTSQVFIIDVNSSEVILHSRVDITDEKNQKIFKNYCNRISGCPVDSI